MWTIIDEESIKITVADSSEDEGRFFGMRVSATFSDVVFWPFNLGVGTIAGTAGTERLCGVRRFDYDPHKSTLLQDQGPHLRSLST